MLLSPLKSIKNLKQISFVILYLFLGLCNLCIAQNSDYFERITTEKGLSQSDINAIVQDNDGFMWFGTHDGLNRYDGYTFKVYKPDVDKANSISSNLIYALETDNNGNLWIGTTGGGLIFFDRISETFKTFKHDTNDDKSINGNHVATVYRDKENRLWVGTNMGLNMIDLNNINDGIQFKRFKANQEPFVPDRNIRSVNTVFEDSNGHIWIGGFAGIYKLSRERNGDMYFRYMSKDIGLPIASVKSIREHKGRLLISTSKGLYFQKKHTNELKVEQIFDGSFNNILLHNDIAWVGTNQGLWKLKFPSNVPMQLVKKYTYDPKNMHSISKDNITSLYRDKTGVIWAGTNGGGVNKLDPNRKQFAHIKKTLSPTSLSYDKIRALFEDSNKRLWIGTEGGGLNVTKDGKNYDDFYQINKLLNVYAIEEITRNGKNYLLFGGQGNGEASMFEIDISNLNVSIQNRGQSQLVNTFKPISDFSNSIFSLLKDSRNYLWIGTYNGGLYRWIPNPDGTYQKHNFVNDSNDSHSLSGDIIRHIYEDSFGNIWLATDKGLNFLSKNEVHKAYPSFTTYQNIQDNTDTISHDYILSIHEDKEKNIWVGTFGGGLNVLKRKKDGSYNVFKSYSEKDGLSNNVIKGILEDDDHHLWFSTNKGLSRFDYKEETFKNYDVNDGLQSNEFQELAYCKRHNGEFLFGGVNGFNAFYPKNLRENTYASETVITNFFISNKEVGVGETIGKEIILDKPVNRVGGVSLKHFQNNISFEFAALHFAAPEKNRFMYKLEGFDKNWQTTPSSKRYAAYTNLSPGDYTFKVKSSNNDGLWNETPASINLHISPPFWLTWWAYMLYGLAIIAVLWSIQSYLHLRSKQRASLEVQKEIEHVNKLKLQFFTNISHEFKTPITLILNPIEELLESINDNQVIQSKLKVVQRNANSLLRLVHQLMEFRRIEVGETKLGATKSNIINFIKEITFSFNAPASKKGVDIYFDSKLSELQVWFDWDKLEKILNNLIHNAVKFTPDGGEIKVKVSKSKTNEELQIPSRTVNTGFLRIEITDTGVGMDKAELPYVFQRFYQVNQSKKVANKGSGIGLAITKDLVDLHHGEISVTSEKGEGTTFQIKLPLGKSHLLPEEIVEIDISEPVDEAIIDDEVVNRESLNYGEEVKDKNVVLVVDDNKDIRALVREGLSDDYYILEAENGKEALHITLKEIPDLVITDVLMPEMDGVEFCREVKTNIRTSHIPIIMLTALNAVEHRIEGLESGADAYIPKPFKMKLLSVRVGKLIDSRTLMRKRFQTEKELTPEKITLNSIDEEFLKRIMEFMEANINNESYWVEELASDMNTSRSTFFRKLKKLTGQSPNDFMRMVRLKRAAQLLEQNELTISQVSYMVGFNDPGYFGKCFRKAYGVSPSNYAVHSKA